MTTLASSTFTGTTGDPFPAEWTNARTTSGSTSTIDANRGKQVTSAVGGYTDYRTDRLNFGTTTNGTLTGTVMVPTTGEAYPQIWFRGDTTLGVNGYFFSLEPSGSRVQFYKRVSGVQSAIGSSTSFTFAGGTVYNFKVQWFGTTLRAKIWETTEPGSWTVTTTDSSHSSAGSVGVGIDGGDPAIARTVFWDDIVLDDNNVTVTPSSVPAPATVPTPVVSIGHTVPPSAVACVVVAPVPTITTNTNATATPAAAPVAVTVPAPTVLAPDAVVQPLTAAVVAGVPLPTLTASATVTAASVAVQADIPNPQVVRAIVVPAQAITRAVAVPTPVIDTTGVAPTHVLTDTFSFEDTVKWDGWDDDVIATLGRLSITCTNTNLGLVSDFHYKLNDSHLYMEVPQVPNAGNGGTYAQMYVEYGDNRIGFRWANGNLVFRERVAGVDSDTSVTYNPVTHRWWRIAMTGTTLVWSTSEDGVTWTNRRSKTTTLNPNFVNVLIDSGYTGTETSPGTFLVDHLNTQATVVTPTPDPLPDTGWWAEVRDITTQEVMARVYDFTELSFLDPTDEAGLGTVLISRSSPLIAPYDENDNPNILPNGLSATTLYRQPYYWDVMDNGVRRFRFVTEVNERMSADPKLDDTVKITGPGHANVLSWGVCLPADIGAAAASRVFTGTNWATVWLTLLDEAKLRGAVPLWVTPTFDAHIDSNGVNWPDFGDYEVKPGVDLLNLLNTFKESIGFVWHMDPNGYLTVAMEYGVDRSDTVRFHEGTDIWSAEDNTNGTDVKSDVFIEGGDGFITQATNTETRTTWGHREVYVQASTALGELAGQIFATGTLSQVRVPVFSRKFVINPFPMDDEGVSLGRRVYVDYQPGDFIGYNNPEVGGASDFKLISVAITVDKTGIVSQEIVTDSRRESFAERIRRLLRQQLGGNYVAGSGAGNDVTGGSTALDQAVGDTAVPGVPVLNTPTSSSAMGDNGIEQAQVNLTWTQPLNTDSTPIVDGHHYEIGYRILGAPDYEVLIVAWDQTQVSIDGLTPNTSYQIRIRAVDYASPINYGEWSSPITYLTIIDTTAPPTPAAPSCATSIISVQVTHTLGVSTGGTYNLPVDLDHLEVHAGTTFNFPISPTSLIGKLPANKGMLVGNIPAVGTFPISSTTLTYFKVVAVDKTGNRSSDSGSASSTATLIDTSHISDLTASKITAGTITAALLLTGSIKTATSGSRVEIDANGVRLYNSGGSNTVNLSTITGNATITGDFSTGSSGRRIVIDSGGNGTIWFYPTSGSDYAFINSPSSNSVGVNSGNGGGTNSTRLFCLPTEAELLFMVQATQAQNGGRVAVNANGVDITTTSGDIDITGQTGLDLRTNTGFTTILGPGGVSLTSSGGNALFGSFNNTFIQCVGANGDTTVRASDQLTLYGDGRVLMQSVGGNTDIYAADNINVQCSGGMYLASSSEMNLSSGTVNLGNGSNAQSIVSGSIYNAISTFAANVGIATTPFAKFYRLTSSRRYKVGIRPLSVDPYTVLRLQPVTYYDKGQWVDNGLRADGLSRQVGLIAEDVAVVPGIGTDLTELDDEGRVSSVNYDRVAVVLLHVIQDMDRRIRELEAR
jgi:hypothetical protein